MYADTSVTLERVVMLVVMTKVVPAMLFRSEYGASNELQISKTQIIAFKGDSNQIKAPDIPIN